MQATAIQKSVGDTWLPTRIGVLMRAAGVLVKTAPTRISAMAIKLMTTFEGPLPRNLRESAGTFIPLLRMLTMPLK